MATLNTIYISPSLVFVGCATGKLDVKGISRYSEEKKLVYTFIYMCVYIDFL
jgi:hypothetical protein